MALKKSRNQGATHRYAKTGAAISAGDIVMLNSAGEALTMAASASNQGCVGVCVEDAAAADAEVVVATGEFLCDATSIAQTSVGLKVYFSAADTIDETAAVNGPLVGILKEVVSSTSGWVHIDPFINAATV